MFASTFLPICCSRKPYLKLLYIFIVLIMNDCIWSVLVWEGGGDHDQSESSETAVWSNSSALAVDARRAVRCGARLVRLQWRKADASGSASWRDADLTSLHHHREVATTFVVFFRLFIDISSFILLHYISC